VTIGLSVLQQLIRDNAAHPPIERDGEIRLPSRILLLPAPGDQHIFGILILSNTLDTSLYDIDMEFDVIDADHVTSIVADRPCDCVSFSCSNDRCLDALSESVSKLRAFTGFGRRPIIVGGPAISRSPGIVDELGANGTAGDETGFASLLHRLLYARTASTIARQSLGTA
jgi:hypothetical protein